MNIRWIVTGLVVLICSVLALDSFSTIDQGERGVVLRAGAVHRIMEPGLHPKIPLYESTVRISVATKSTHVAEMGRSSDEQNAKLAVTVNWSIDPTRVDELYTSWRTLDNAEVVTVRPRVTNAIKGVFGTYTANRATQKKLELATEILGTLQLDRKIPVIFHSADIGEVDFSEQYDKAIERRMQAEMAVEEVRQNFEREKVQAEIVVQKAKAEAARVREAALAQAEATIAQGEAEARAIEARGQALARNPGLVSLVQAERWDGKLPTMMYKDGFLPILNTGPPSVASAPPPTIPR